MDRAGADYWDSNWEAAEIPVLFDPNDNSLDNYVNQKLHHYFKRILGNKRNMEVMEIGCANSIWPIYFYMHHGAVISGIDYSKVGCKKSEDMLKHYEVPGKIYCADLFSPPDNIVNQYDLVVSFGVVEHFDDTALCLESCAKLVKPGGLLLTLIPNIPGLVGSIQKLVDRSVFDVHFPITKKALSDSHLKAGLELIECKYFLSINLSVVNSGRLSNSKANKYLRHALSIPSKLIWFLEKRNIKLIPENSFTSPYIIALAKKPSGHDVDSRRQG